MNNLEWLYKHDDKFAVDVQKCVKSYDGKPRWMSKDTWLMHEHETNGTDGETNGIADDAPLVDPVEIMRECGGMEHGMGSLRKVLGIECVAGWQMRCLNTLADMVERDYVRRDDYDFAIEMLNCMKSECDEWKAKAESYRQYADQRECVESGARESCTNLEWLFEHDRDMLIAMAASCCDCGYCTYHETEECVEDTLYGENDCYGGCREWLMAEHAMDAQRDTNGTCPDGNETCPNDNLAPEHDVSADDVDANDASEALDSREKLEADVKTTFGDGLVRSIIMRLLDRQAAITTRECKERVDFSLITQTANALFPDYQERIAELQEKVDALSQANDDYREEWHRVCAERMELRRELTASKNEGVRLAEELGKTMAERDEWRNKCGAMLDAAQEIRRLADIE